MEENNSNSKTEFEEVVEELKEAEGDYYRLVSLGETSPNLDDDEISALLRELGDKEDLIGRYHNAQVKGSKEVTHLRKVLNAYDKLSKTKGGDDACDGQ